MTSARKRAYLALIITAILWGVALPLVKLALPYTTPSRWLFYRYLFAVPFSFPLLFYYLKKYRPPVAQIATIMLLELMGTTAVLGLLYLGLSQTSALDASLLSSLSPLFVIIAGILFLKERENRNEWMGFGIALSGALLITLEPLIALGKLSNGSSIAGNSIIILHNIVWAGYLVVVKRVYRTIPKPLITSLGFLVGLISFGLIAFLTTPSFLLADLTHPWVLIAALYMAIPGSIIAATLYLYGQNLIEISEATLFTYLQSIVSIPLAIWFLGDHLRLSTLFGIGIIVIGVYLAERRPHRV